MSWSEHRTNVSILQELQPPDWLLAKVQATILWSCGPCKKSVNWNAGRKNRWETKPGKPVRWWTDDVKDCTSITMVECSQQVRDWQQWRTLVHEVISDTQQWAWKQKTETEEKKNKKVYRINTSYLWVTYCKQIIIYILTCACAYSASFLGGKWHHTCS